MSTVRKPAVAGQFYPSGAAELAATVDAMLAAVPPRSGPTPKALIAPHAGFVYSGPVAASAYALLAPDKGLVSRIVLLGPAHRARLRGLALPGVDALATPLGPVPIDASGVEALSDLPHVVTSQEAHAHEHALEVHLPFLQRVLGTFSVIPLVVGEASPEEVAQVIERLWGGPESRVVVSSDLSHYLPYPIAKSVDESTARNIEQRQYVDPERACGARAVNGLLLVARRRGLTLDRIDLRNSGDTSGSKAEVVGYGSFALHPSAS